MEDKGPKRNPFSEGIKEAVALTNMCLSKTERLGKDIQKPIAQSFGIVEDKSSKMLDVALDAYGKRKEYGFQIITSSFAGFGVVGLVRRGRIGGIISASVAGAAAYGIVYDKLSIQGVVDSVLPKTD
ncbi:unnamed protein product [Cylindrotheca closterium]|uniref:Uncharacterized protein n=1 Tax=Cylindrotheca closterium TaxID=2856 RepID=A0AAD2G5M9_9STRA|nr:unnamed protein product [Cylindrotheca closterium]